MVTKRLIDNKTIRSIESFINQSYLNKELIIVCSHCNIHDIKTINKYIDNKISFLIYKISNNISLGEARNISINISNGEYICQWDDDDISHPDRLQYQYDWNIQNNCNASILSAQYHLFENVQPNKLYLENRIKKNENIHSGWPGTILAKKSILKDIYPKIRINEDVDGLSKIQDLQVIKYENDFYHYIYSFHGNNTWNYDHNKYMINNNKIKPKCDITQLKTWIESFKIKLNYELVY